MTGPPQGSRAEDGAHGPDWQQVADAFWLAACNASLSSEPSPAASPALPTPTGPGRPPHTPPAATPQPEHSDRPPVSEGAEHLLRLSSPRRPASATDSAQSAAADTLITPGARLGPSHAPLRERSLQRALRPFRRTVPSLVAEELDEEATADRAAQEGLWLPQCVPVPERWMDVVVVADHSRSMIAWRRTAAWLVTVLERTGAFRSVRVHHINADHPLPAHGPSPLGSSRLRGDCAIVVLTDGVGEAWREEGAVRRIGQWTRQATVAFLHVLSQDSWHRTHLEPTRLRVRIPGPAAPNSCWRPGDGGSWPGGRPPVPMLELDARWIHRWARLVTRPTAHEQEILAFLPGVPDDEPEEEAAPTAWERVARFRAGANPAAFRLASRLAAAPLNIQAMEFVQSLHEPDSGPGDLAEVLLGGLMYTVDTEDPRDESQIGFEFHPGVRGVLLSAGMRDESLYILRSTLDRIGRRWGPLHALRDVLSQPSGPVEGLPLTDRLLPYMRLAEQVYLALSGPYLKGAEALRARIVAQEAVAHSDHTRDPERKRRVAEGEHHPRGPTTTPPQPAPPSSRAGKPDRPPSPPTHRMTGAGDEDRRGSSVTAATPLPSLEERRAGDPPPIWGSVPPRNNNFTGRQALLDTLHERLRTEGTTAVLPEALHGLGGVGKSQIALEYVHQYASDYDAVWWIPAERPEQIRQALVELAERLHLQAGLESNIAVPRVLEALRTGRPCRNWLLVFDNAEDLETVRPFFPTDGPGRILVTSRNARWAQAARTVEVDVFARNESIALLRKRGPELPEDQAYRIAEALGDLPLAIEQAAAWLTETGMPVGEYLQIFEDERAGISTRRHELLAAGVPVDYPEPVAAAWNMSLQRLAEHHPGALQLLRLCSGFAPEPISRRLLSGVRGVSLSPELAEVLQDPIKLGHAIREVNRYALMKINHRSNTIEMHRLVQAVLTGQMSTQQQADMRHSAHVLLAHGDPNDISPPNFSRYADLFSHARASRAWECEDKWVRQMVRNVIRFLYAWGDHEGCRAFAGQVVEAWRESLGEESLETLSASRTLGHALNVLGHYSEARELNARTLALLRNSPAAGEDHEDTLSTIGAVAHDARLMGDFAKALELEYGRWVRAVRLFGDEDPLALGAANDYAQALRAAGDFPRARQISRSARDTAAVVLGEDALLTILLDTNLSVDIRESGDYLGARDVQERTYERSRHSLPENAPVATNALRALGVARRKAGDHEGARELTREALRRHRLRYTEPNLRISATELTLSIDLRQNADLSGAREVGEKCLNDMRTLLGPRHPVTSSAATNLAITLRLLGDSQAALALNSGTLPVLTETVGNDHPIALACAVNLASDHYTLQNYSEAHRLDAEALAGCRAKLGEDHPTTLACMVNTAADLRALGQSQEAQELHDGALARYRRVLHPQHPATVAAARGIRADCDIEALSL